MPSSHWILLGRKSKDGSGRELISLLVWEHYSLVVRSSLGVDSVRVSTISFLYLVAPFSASDFLVILLLSFLRQTEPHVVQADRKPLISLASFPKCWNDRFFFSSHRL